MDQNDSSATTSQESSATQSAESSASQSHQTTARNSSSKAESMGDEEEEDDGMLIEQLGRNYLCRNNTIRRHTIGTNADKDPGSEIVKSTECLLMLDENEETKLEQQPLFKQFINPAPENQLLLSGNCIIPTISHTTQPATVCSSQQPQQPQENTINSNVKLLKPAYRSFKPRTPNRFMGGIDHKQQHSYNNETEMQPNNMLHPSFVNRRASDGGSNIILFNQIYANNKSSNELDIGNKARAAVVGQQQQQDSQMTSGNPQSSQFNGPTKHLSRGSITSGIPIFPSSSQLSPSTTSSDSQNLNSSEDEENYQSIIRTRKNSRTISRHEPYPDTAAGGCNLLSAGGTASKRKSFSGSTSPPVMASQLEPYKKLSDPIELIRSNK